MEKNILRKKLLLLSLLQSAVLLSGCQKDIDDLEIPPLVPMNTDIYYLDEPPTGSIIIDSKLEEQDYDFKEIEKALDDNENLTEEEKNFIKQLKFVFDDNYKYMNINDIIERLSTLKIEYIQDMEEINSNVRGYYTRSINKIVVLGCNDFESTDINVFVHEFLHVLQNPSKDFTRELSNEFFTREIVRKLYDDKIISEEKINKISGGIGEPKIYGKGYNDYMCLYYTLAELVDEETLRKYQFNCDIKTLVKGVSDTNGRIIPQDEIHNFINYLNNSRIYNEKTNMYEPSASFEVENIIQECYNSLNYYFVEKYGYNISDDLRVSILYYDRSSNSFFVTASYNPYDSREDEILEEQCLEYAESLIGENARMVGFLRTVTPRTYLSDDHLNPEFTFNSPSYITIEIDDKFIHEFNNRLSESNKVLTINQ